MEITEGFNNLVDVNFVPNVGRLMCTFKNQPQEIIKHCDANVTYGDNCDKLLNVYKGMDIGDAVLTLPLETVPGVTDYCFVVTAISNNVTVMVEGNLVNIGKSL